MMSDLDTLKGMPRSLTQPSWKGAPAPLMPLRPLSPLLCITLPMGLMAAAPEMPVGMGAGGIAAPQTAASQPVSLQSLVVVMLAQGQLQASRAQSGWRPRQSQASKSSTVLGSHRPRHAGELTILLQRGADRQARQAAMSGCTAAAGIQPDIRTPGGPGSPAAGMEGRESTHWPPAAREYSSSLTKLASIVFPSNWRPWNTALALAAASASRKAMYTRLPVFWETEGGGLGRDCTLHHAVLAGLLLGVLQELQPHKSQTAQADEHHLISLSKCCKALNREKRPEY